MKNGSPVCDSQYTKPEDGAILDQNIIDAGDDTCGSTVGNGQVLYVNMSGAEGDESTCIDREDGSGTADPALRIRPSRRYEVQYERRAIDEVPSIAKQSTKSIECHHFRGTVHIL